MKNLLDIAITLTVGASGPVIGVAFIGAVLFLANNPPV